MICANRQMAFYHVLTDPVVASWHDAHPAILQQTTTALRASTNTAAAHADLASLYQEIIASVLSQRLSPHDAGSLVASIVSQSQSPPLDSSSSLSSSPSSSSPSSIPPAAYIFADTLSVFLESDPSIPPSSIRPLLEASRLPPAILREALDAPVLQKVGLIRDSFVKHGIRHATNVLYRQANYNLLREESEGYAKLVTELFTITHSGPPTAALVENAFEKVRALIGTFDLDVGRVLDVTLDVFAPILIKHFRFFVKFLRVSSWWPTTTTHTDDDPDVDGGLPLWAYPGSNDWQTSREEEARLTHLRNHRDSLFWPRARQHGLEAFFELGGRHIDDDAALDDANSSSQSHQGSEWIRATKTRPPTGNRTAAQLLGFKLRFYASETRDEDDILPANLLYLAALLIKIGFIALPDLYPHLYPADEDMDALRERALRDLEEKERKNRPGGGMNALLMAGALPDDMPHRQPNLDASSTQTTTTSQDPSTSTSTSTSAESTHPTEPAKPPLPDPLEQKVTLLVCLLTIGALPEALFLLGRFPWLLETHPEILHRIHRILHHCLSKVYQESKPVPSSASASASASASTSPLVCPPRAVPQVDQGGAAKGTVLLAPIPQKRPLRWPFPATHDTNDHQDYRFYWDEWADAIPVCQSVDDVFTLCDSLLSLSGVNIGQDASLLAKLTSIGAASLRQDTSPANRDRWKDLLRRLLLPALSLTSANPALVHVVWELLRQYPLATRYTMYAEWYEGAISRLGPVKAAFQRTRLETLGIMKRLSHTNLSEMAKSLAKASSYSSPGVVFKVALSQIESYANLIEAFVECAKYFTDLAYDVLVWSLLNSLGGHQRSRTQASSVLLTSKWLQALSRFSGKVFRRYALMDPTPVLRYVHHQLFHGNSTDLIILKELISSMGGIVPTIDFTDDQIMAMSGGPLLQKQTLTHVLDKRFDSVRSATRLTHALVQSGLAGPLLVNIAQYRQSAIYTVPDHEAHIKYLSSLVDDSHQILTQYLDLLQTNLEPRVLDALIPSVDQLMVDFGLDANLAFMLGRANLAEKLLSVPETPDVDMDDAGVGEKTEENKTEGNKKEDDRTLSLSYHLLTPLLDIVRCSPNVNPSAWKAITPELYVTFWTLRLGDIFVPEGWYVKENDRIQAQVKEAGRDRSDMSKNGIAKREEKTKALQEQAKALKKEKTEHQQTCQRNLAMLTHATSQWFSPCAKGRSIADALLEQCILPRLLLSAADAEFCFRFVRLLHDLNTPRFRLKAFYDRLFHANRLRTLLFSCTVQEVEHLGRFLRRILGDLSRWHQSATVYEKEALGGRKPKGAAREGEGKKDTDHDADSPDSESQVPEDTTLVTGKNLPPDPDYGNRGFAAKFHEDGSVKAFLDHDQFRDLLYHWHKELNEAIKACLKGTEWMHIRNAITMVKSVVDHFPVVNIMAQRVLKQLQTISDRESKASESNEEDGNRVDLSVAAQTAFSALQRQKAKWVMLQSFRTSATTDSHLDEESAAMAHGSNQTAKTKLRPTAPAFTPGGNHSSHHAFQGSLLEDEDGEVKDSVGDNAFAGRSSSKRKAESSLPMPPKPSFLHKLPAGLPNRPDLPLPNFATGMFNQRNQREARDTPAGNNLGNRDARESRDPRENRESSGRSHGRSTTRDASDGNRRDSRTVDQHGRLDVPMEVREHRSNRADSASRSDSSRRGRDQDQKHATTTSSRDTKSGREDTSSSSRSKSSKSSAMEAPPTPSSLPPPPQPHRGRRETNEGRLSTPVDTTPRRGRASSSRTDHERDAASDRLETANPSPSQSRKPQTPVSDNTDPKPSVGIHPDRLRQIAGTTNNNNNNPSPRGPPASSPRGPLGSDSHDRNRSSAHQAPSSPATNPGSGRHFKGINSTLKQAATNTSPHANTIPTRQRPSADSPTATTPVTERDQNIPPRPGSSTRSSSSGARHQEEDSAGASHRDRDRANRSSQLASRERNNPERERDRERTREQDRDARDRRKDRVGGGDRDRDRDRGGRERDRDPRERDRSASNITPNTTGGNRSGDFRGNPRRSSDLGPGATASGPGSSARSMTIQSGNAPPTGPQLSKPQATSPASAQGPRGPGNNRDAPRFRNSGNGPPQQTPTGPGIHERALPHGRPGQNQRQSQLLPQSPSNSSHPANSLPGQQHSNRLPPPPPPPPHTPAGRQFSGHQQQQHGHPNQQYHHGPHNAPHNNHHGHNGHHGAPPAPPPPGHSPYGGRDHRGGRHEDRGGGRKRRSEGPPEHGDRDKRPRR